MASYFVYLAAGLYESGVGEAGLGSATWNDEFEDGQGMGWSTGACAPVFDITKNPVQLLSMNCLALSVALLKRMHGYDAAWAAAMERRRRCPELGFTTAQLEALRPRS